MSNPAAQACENANPEPAYRPQSTDRILIIGPHLRRPEYAKGVERQRCGWACGTVSPPSTNPSRFVTIDLRDAYLTRDRSLRLKHIRICRQQERNVPALRRIELLNYTK